MSEEVKAEQTPTKGKPKNIARQFLVWAIIIIGLPVAIYYLIGSENYSNGERIGLVTQFSKRGVMFKSWEGHLNITQTGMNSADGFDFSLDRTSGLSKNSEKLLDSSATYGWKVKLIYHAKEMNLA